MYSLLRDVVSFGITVNVALLLVTLLIRQRTGPVAVEGTVVRMRVSLQLIGVAATSLKDTLIVPGLYAAPNPDPLIVHLTSHVTACGRKT